MSSCIIEHLSRGCKNMFLLCQSNNVVLLLVKWLWCWLVERNLNILLLFVSDIQYKFIQVKLLEVKKQWKPTHNTQLASLPFDYHIFWPLIGHYMQQFLCSGFRQQTTKFYVKGIACFSDYNGCITAPHPFLVKFFGGFLLKLPYRQTHKLMHCTVFYFSYFYIK
jgi:hypothetical protein